MITSGVLPTGSWRGCSGGLVTNAAGAAFLLPPRLGAEVPVTLVPLVSSFAPHPRVCLYPCFLLQPISAFTTVTSFPHPLSPANPYLSPMQVWLPLPRVLPVRMAEQEELHVPCILLMDPRVHDTEGASAWPL